MVSATGRPAGPGTRGGQGPDAGRWGVALVAATALHAGFQLTVSTVVYPALADRAPAEHDLPDRVPADRVPADHDPADHDPADRGRPGQPGLEPAASGWSRAHAAHSRRIGPLVAVVYPGLALALAGRLRAAPDVPTLLAAGCSAGVVILTAAVAAPLHGRLGPEPEPVLVRRLLVADRGRSAFAVGALAAALAGAGRAAPGDRSAARLPVPGTPGHR